MLGVMISVLIIGLLCGAAIGHVVTRIYQTWQDETAGNKNISVSLGVCLACRRAFSHTIDNMFPNKTEVNLHE